MNCSDSWRLERTAQAIHGEDRHPIAASWLALKEHERDYYRAMAQTALASQRDEDLASEEMRRMREDMNVTREEWLAARQRISLLTGVAPLGYLDRLTEAALGPCPPCAPMCPRVS